MSRLELGAAVARVFAHFIGLREGYIRRAVFDEGIPLERLNVVEQTPIFGPNTWVLRADEDWIASISFIASGLEVRIEHRWLR